VVIPRIDLIWRGGASLRATAAMLSGCGGASQSQLAQSAPISQSSAGCRPSAGISYGGGAVSIFAHAKGTPEVYTDSEIPHFNFCGYDPKGNLHADGTDASQTEFHFAELPKGEKTFENITLTGGSIYYPGMVQWDGCAGGLPNHRRRRKDRTRDTA